MDFQQGEMLRPKSVMDNRTRGVTMAVLIEANSVVVRVDAIQRVYPHGMWDFRREVPNRTFCTDGRLARVGFMAPGDVERYIDVLMLRGLRVRRREVQRDVVVIDQEAHSVEGCPWLLLRRLPMEDGHVAAAECTDATATGGASLKASPEMIVVDGVAVAVPAQWRYASSISSSSRGMTAEEGDARLQVLQEEAGLYTCFDAASGRVVYVGGTQGGGEVIGRGAREQRRGRSIADFIRSMGRHPSYKGRPRRPPPRV